MIVRHVPSFTLPDFTLKFDELEPGIYESNSASQNEFNGMPLLIVIGSKGYNPTRRTYLSYYRKYVKDVIGQEFHAGTLVLANLNGWRTGELFRRFGGTLIMEDVKVP